MSRSEQAQVSTGQLDIRQIVQESNAALGPTLVAALAGSKEREQQLDWANPNGAEPGPQYVARLTFAHEEWTRLVSGEDDQVARIWFIGANPRLHEDSPVTAIREDRCAEVTAAVTSFLEGSGDW